MRADERIDDRTPSHGAAPHPASASFPTFGFLLGWIAAGLILVLLLPKALLGDWPWELARKEVLPYALLIGAFGACALLILLLRPRTQWPRWPLAVVGSAALFSLLLLFFFLVKASSSRALLLAVFGLTLALLPLPYLHARIRLLAIGVMAAALLAVAGLGVRKHHTENRSVAAERTQSSVSTNLYNLRLISHLGRIKPPVVRGGGLTPFGDRVLLATGDGWLYLLDPRRDALDVQTLAYRVPLNGEEFAKAAGGEYKEPEHSSEFGRGAAPGVQTWRFRTADVLAQDMGDRIRLFASHHFWNAADKCFLLRVSTVDVQRDGTPLGSEVQWRTLFDSAPCLPLTGKDAKRGKNPFQGEEIGGRMVLLDDNTLLLSTGDLSFSGIDSWQVFSQDPQASYGKTLKISIDSGASEVFTLGHRNPQGLFRDENGDLWSTEHGAKGGDELNLLRPGTNYGWPLVTYGTDYQSFSWPLSAQQGRHDGYQEPVYSWVPSVGISNLIRVTHDLFPGWRGDLLAGSLSTRSLYRLRMKDQRVVFAEPIPLQQRVRDLLELADGRILVWTDQASIMEVAPTNEMNGELLFGTMCQTCHWINDGQSHRAGPDLAQIVGRDIASAGGFGYSGALQRLDGKWTEPMLDRFIADPQAVAPGTSMAFEGIDDAQQRKLLIEYLEQPKQQ